jgi:hypothetical protein
MGGRGIKTEGNDFMILDSALPQTASFYVLKFVVHW